VASQWLGPSPGVVWEWMKRAVAVGKPSYTPTPHSTWLQVQHRLAFDVRKHILSRSECTFSVREEALQCGQSVVGPFVWRGVGVEEASGSSGEAVLGAHTSQHLAKCSTVYPLTRTTSNHINVISVVSLLFPLVSTVQDDSRL